MKIAIFSDTFYPEISGISDSVIALAKELSKKGHSIQFYVPRYSPANYKVVNLPPGHEPDLGERIKIHRLFSFPYPGATRQARFTIPLPWHWFERNFHPDVIHTQLFFGAGLDALIRSRLKKIPLVGTNHTAITEFLRYSPVRGKWIENLVSGYVNWYYGKCAYVTAPSESVFREMTPGGFPRPHRAISNPIDL